MKQIIIGDIHGHDTWKRIIEQEKTFDRIVFLGDYHDSFKISSKSIVDNFKSIVELKNSLKNKVVLLCGNHDYHYIEGIDSKFSGYRPELKGMQKEMLFELIQNDTIQLCFKDEENRLYSHAGISRTWLKNLNKDISIENIDKELNNLFKNSLGLFNFVYGKSYNYYGDDPENGPLWIRPNSLYYDAINEYDQIVGHTQPQYPLVIKSNQKTNIYLADTLKFGYYIVSNEVSIGFKQIKI